jgi:hypothetical protein
MHVVMLHTPGFLPADISTTAARAYCNLWGYRFDYHDSLICSQWVPSWNKILALENAMKLAHQDEWLAWIDADILILRHNLSLESFVVEGKDLIFSTDNGGMCSGFFLIRKCSAMESFLKNLHSSYCATWPWEQAAIKKAIAGDAYLQHVTTYIPSSMIQSPESIFNADAFAMHYWSRYHGSLITKQLMSLTIQRGWAKEILTLSRKRRLPKNELVK